MIFSGFCNSSQVNQPLVDLANGDNDISPIPRFPWNHQGAYISRNKQASKGYRNSDREIGRAFGRAEKNHQNLD